MFLNPDLHIHSAHELESYPHFVPAQSREELSVFDQILWVKNQISGLYFPWLVGTHVVEMVQRAYQSLTQVSEYEIRILEDLGLFYTSLEQLLIERKSFAQRLELARQQMSLSQYCVLPKVLIDTYHNTVNYYMKQAHTLLVPDHQSALRFGRHNLALFRVLHSQLTFLVQSVVEEPLKASYCYAVTYTQGAELPKHTDRPQCEWNASIVFASSSVESWPIWLETDTNQEVRAGVGEVVVYRGTKVPHWRESLPHDFSTIAFFHFVPQAFTDNLN